jgi:hypothetical protein
LFLFFFLFFFFVFFFFFFFFPSVVHDRFLNSHQRLRRTLPWQNHHEVNGTAPKTVIDALPYSRQLKTYNGVFEDLRQGDSPKHHRS